jgi:hypothetical protein
MAQRGTAVAAAAAEACHDQPHAPLAATPP